MYAPSTASGWAPDLYGTYNRVVTVRIGDLLRIPGLALTLVGGAEGRERPLRWVHVSELEDPTPWLKGGELLLTTGMGLGKSPARQRAYLERLAAADLCGLGLGVGFSFTKVPKAMADAADRLGFPVFEVPYPVPFIAITEAIYSRLAAEQVEAFQRSLEAQAALTRSVLDGGGIEGVAAALARATHGWAVVLDLHGIPLGAAPDSAAERAPRLWEELRESRPSEPGFSVSMLDRGDHVSVQPIGARGRVEAFLAMGKGEGLSQFDRIVASHALSLLAVELDKSRALAEAERRLRGDLLDALVEGRSSPEEVARGLRRFGLAADDRLAVLALESQTPIHELTWAVEDVLSRRRGGFLTAPRDEVLYVVMAPHDPRSLEDLRVAISERLGAPVTVGAGAGVAPGETARSFREARYALQVCRVDDRRLADFASLGTYRLLLSLQEPDALRAFADSVLSPLDRYDQEDGGDLLGSLRSFLEHNARWEAAAGALFVHRHTLRYRMRKVEELTGRDLGSPHDRMEFWLALRARELLARD